MLSIPLIHIAAAACLGVVWLDLLRRPLVRADRFLALFVIVSALCFGLKWLAYLTLPPYPDYYRVYVLASLPPVFAAAALLLTLNTATKRWVSPGLLLALVGAGLLIAWDTPVVAEFQGLLRLTNGSYLAISVLGLVTLGRLLLSGTTDTALLLRIGGVAFPYAAFSLNHLGYFSGLWTVHWFAQLGEPILVVSWLLIWFGVVRQSSEENLKHAVPGFHRAADRDTDHARLVLDRTHKEA